MKLVLAPSSHSPIGCDLSCRFLISWSFSSIAWCKSTWNSLSFWTNSSNNLWSNGKEVHISLSGFRFSGSKDLYYTSTGNLLGRDKNRLLQLSEEYPLTIDLLWPIRRHKHSVVPKAIALCLKKKKKPQTHQPPYLNQGAKLCDIIFFVRENASSHLPADIFKGTVRVELWWKYSENLWLHFLNGENKFSSTQGLSLPHTPGTSCLSSYTYEEREGKISSVL